LYRKILIMLAGAAVAMGAAGCGSAAPQQTTRPAVSSPAPAPTS